MTNHRLRIAPATVSLVLILFALLATTASSAAGHAHPAWPDGVASPGTLRYGGVLPAGDATDTRAAGPEVLVLDTASGSPSFSITGGLPRTVMGEPFDAADPGFPLRITRVELFLVSTATQTYENGLCIRLRFWEDHDLTSSPVFSTPVGLLYHLRVPGPVALDPNVFYIYSRELRPPADFANLTGNGFVVNFQGDNGSGCQDSNDLTALIRFVDEPDQAPIAVGSIPLQAPRLGFYRNSTTRTDFNFEPADLRYIQGTNSNAVAIRLYAADPGTPSGLYLPLLLRSVRSS
jgi:hypothetical protein